MFDRANQSRFWFVVLLFVAGAMLSVPASSATVSADSADFRTVSHSHHTLVADDIKSDHNGHVLCAADPCGSVWAHAAAAAAGGAIASHMAIAVAFDAAAQRAFVVRASGNNALAHRRATVLLI